ncbi:MAG: tagatose 1,6-diphosphate aldolase [Dehalococcoidales bacterium]|nr:tagatose 1,6-diphosphate aldolase [Dehalococcoidales bacterium]
MSDLSIGKIAGLRQIATTDGIFTMCAMDHRDSLRSMIDRQNPERIGYEEMVKRKLELCTALAEHASAVLLDPVFGAAQCIGQGALPKTTGLLVSIEASGYGEKESRLTGLLDDWGVEKIKRMGASAVKILLYYRPDLKELAQKQLETVDMVALECIKHDIPFLVEPKTYPVGNEIKHPEELSKLKGKLVIETARDVNNFPIDVLKAEFPADPPYPGDKSGLIELCRQLDRASRVPWVVLSAGVEFDVFCQQVEIACRAGASGFLAGRAIWQEATRIEDDGERVHYLSTVAVERLEKLSEIAAKYAVPWYRRFGASFQELADISEGWYRSY